MIVQLKSRHPSYPDLSEGRNYFVLGIEANDDRLLNDRGQPYLYDAGLFDIVESMEPADWINDVGEDGERYAYPAPLNAPGFFEDFFDQKPEQVSIFRQIVNQQLAHAA